MFDFFLRILLRSLLCGETSQRINFSFASPIKAPFASSGVVTPETSMPASMATSTPIKLLESPHKNQGGSVASSWPGARSTSPVQSSLMSSSPGSSAGVTPDSAVEAKRARAGSLIDSVDHSARMVIEVSLFYYLDQIKNFNCYAHRRFGFLTGTAMTQESSLNGNIIHLPIFFV